jgi:hypothetical protein
MARAAVNKALTQEGNWDSLSFIVLDETGTKLRVVFLAACCTKLNNVKFVFVDSYELNGMFLIISINIFISKNLRL